MRLRRPRARERAGRPAPLSRLYRHPFRRYQRLALEAFERERAAGRRRVYLVLPPGAGKTALGWEIVRRAGRRALVARDAPREELLDQRRAALDRQLFGPADLFVPTPAVVKEGTWRRTRSSPTSSSRCRTSAISSTACTSGSTA